MALIPRMYILGVMPPRGLCGSINSAVDHTKVGLIKYSRHTPGLHTRSFRIYALHSDDGESNSQEPSTTSQPPETDRRAPLGETVQWAPLGPSPAEKPPPRPVKTRSGIPMFIAPIPDDRCPECNGNGKLTCGACKGKGRLNCRKAPGTMLPSGVWPQWCPYCRASGRWVCSACMGTGERREPMGFRIE